MAPRTVLITGCSKGGIGHALALQYHKAGLRVFATARRLESMTDLAAAGIETLPLDVAAPESIEKLKEAVIEKTGGSLDILVNNAGQSYTLPATDFTLARLQELYAVNLFGVMLMCQAFVPLLKDSKSKEGGKIVNIGSIAAILPIPCGAAYNASKAALHQYSDTLSIELAPFNIEVSTVITGGVKSNIVANNTHSIPDGSLYEGYRQLFKEKRQGVSQQLGMSTEKYAETVVNKTLKRHPPRFFWAGGSVWLIWFSTTFFPRWLRDSILSKRFGLDAFARSLKKKTT